MLQASGDPDLPEESLRAERGGELGAQDLERDGPIVPEVVGEIDGGHAAASELALDAIAIGQGGREEVGRLGQRGNPDAVPCEDGLPSERAVCQRKMPRAVGFCQAGSGHRWPGS